MKLKASIGFHASALQRVCMTSLRTGVLMRRSYRAMLRSLPVVANTSASACTHNQGMGKGESGKGTGHQVPRLHVQAKLGTVPSQSAYRIEAD